MPIETLGDAMTAGWRVHAKCIDGRVDQTHSTRKCHYMRELNIEMESWARESGQVDKWIFCLTTARLAEDQEIR
jgi:hypothetical protein